MNESLHKKKQKLRNNEYYSMQDIFDELYSQSQKGKKFTKLVEIIKVKENILLAYRNIKKNKGSITMGTDGLNIDYIKNMGIDNYIIHIQSKIDNYFPKSVKRVEIPKPNGKTRPLGIPCIDDRIIQQCIKQVLEPICEAKFHKHSYGFRPNRSTHNAIARSNFLMWNAKLHYVVDIDIKGFFDNVNHAKLKKQMWNMGIQDKNLICIIGKILKSEIKGIGIPTKGTPQGGIISPLLSNIVLNELDWWISDQWETFQTERNYRMYRNEGSNIRIDNSHKYRALKKSNLKEMYIVRYADDFKVFCRSYNSAKKIFNATRQWLKERLNLEISEEKSKITNLKKSYTEFLGFRIKIRKKNKKYVSQSHMSKKQIKETIRKLKEQIKVIQKKPEVKEVNKLNSMILGSHNYYKIATLVNLDFGYINFIVSKTLYNRLRSLTTNNHNFSKTYIRLYGEYKGKVKSIRNVTLFPIYGVTTSPARMFNPKICNYTEEGRKLIHDKINKEIDGMITYLLKHQSSKNSNEYNDNRISLLCGQQGKCFVTNKRLVVEDMECHHKTPKEKGGTDIYDNLVWLSGKVHKLVHATRQETIEKYLSLLTLDKNSLRRVNSLRKLVGNSII